MDGLEGQVGPRGVISCADGLDPRDFCWETCAGMEIPDNFLGRWELLNVADGLLGAFW